MTHHEDQAASVVSIDPLLFQEKFDELAADLAPLFTRSEPRAHALDYLRGLVADLPRKNCWTMAEHAGHARAFGLQRLLYQAVWDEDAALGVVRRFAVRHLAAPGAVLVFDETGQEKKGETTAGVGRQYTGTTGQVSNAVVAVYCTYASPLGHCLIDGDLYVQNHWAQDPGRCERAGLGSDFTFRAKTAIALDQARRALATGVAVDWAAGDEVYGRSAKLRGFFEEKGIGYVFAVSVNFAVPTGVGPIRADVLAAKKVPKQAWNRLSCGQGAKGPRVYDWALVATAGPRHHLLVRRGIADPTDLSYFYAYAPPGRSVALADLVTIAGIRWTVEEDFANAKDAVGLDHTQARRYRSWRRHATLAMAALALLSVIASLDRREHPAPVLPTSPTEGSPRGLRADRPDRHRGPTPLPVVHQPAAGPAHRPRHPPHGLPPAMVHLATTPPSTRPLAPLQATPHQPRLNPAPQRPSDHEVRLEYQGAYAGTRLRPGRARLSPARNVSRPDAGPGSRPGRMRIQREFTGPPGAAGGGGPRPAATIHQRPLPLRDEAAGRRTGEFTVDT